MPNRMKDRLSKLERQSPDPEAARLRNIGFLEEALRRQEELHGPLPPQTPEDQKQSRVRLRRFLTSLAEGSPKLKSDPAWLHICGDERE